MNPSLRQTDDRTPNTHDTNATHIVSIDIYNTDRVESRRIALTCGDRGGLPSDRVSGCDEQSTRGRDELQSRVGSSPPTQGDAPVLYECSCV